MRGGGEEFVFVVQFELAVFALELAFGGGEIAEHEVVLFLLFNGPGEDGHAVIEADEEIVMALGAEALPFGLGSFEDEIAENTVFGERAVFFLPAVEQGRPFVEGFVGEDEGFGAEAVFGGVEGRDGLTDERGRPRSAGVAFLAFGVYGVVIGVGSGCLGWIRYRRRGLIVGGVGGLE